MHLHYNSADNAEENTEKKLSYHRETALQLV